jgi:hypothetical protein
MMKTRSTALSNLQPGCSITAPTELPVHCEPEQPPVMSLMIEELEVFIKRENSNITTQ